jgi:hypothetical protein
VAKNHGGGGHDKSGDDDLTSAVDHHGGVK